MKSNVSLRTVPSLFSLIAGGLLAGTGGLQAVAINFNEAGYTASPGQTVAITLSFGAPVPNGLAGYHLRLNAGGAGLFVPDDSSISIVPELDNSLFGEAPADRTIEANRAEILGFSEFGNAYDGVAFVTFNLFIDPNAAAGTYGLTLALPLEGSFVDGDFEVIDDALILGSADLVIEVAAPALSQAPAFDTSAGTFTLTFTGIPGRTYLLEASVDLAEWNPLTTLTAAPSGLITYTDPTAGSLPRRFYRLVD